MTKAETEGSRPVEARTKTTSARRRRALKPRTDQLGQDTDSPGDGEELDRLKTSIGLRLKELRTARGMSVRTLAKKVELTSGFISQVENGRQMPSIATLVRLCAALDIDVGDMFAESAARGRVVRPADRKVYEWETGVHDEVVSADSTKTLEMLHSSFAPGATTGEPFTHGSEIEVAYVTEGTLLICVGESCYELHSGDALTFSGTLPHSVSNKTDCQASVIWALTPATF
jgi:transcriptional regulator with XRE-family HTH domain